jgi:hypothetical protein
LARDPAGRGDTILVRVFFRHHGINQRDEIVCDARRAGLMLMRSATQSAVASRARR